MTNNIYYTILFFILLVVISCKHDPLFIPDPNPNPNPNVPCDSTIVNFQEEILPIFLTNCALSGCHGGSSVQKGIRLDNYTNIIATGRLDINDPEDSKILKDGILETDPDKRMPPPPNPRLSNAQIDKIMTWIRQGAKDTSCAQITCDTLNINYTNKISGILSTYCVACHNPQNISGGVLLNNYTNTRTVALNGRLIGAVEHRAGFVPMPIGGSKLPDCQLKQIKIWVENGAIQ
jgi:mono/diheme cytochrome c family protein